MEASQNTGATGQAQETVQRVAGQAHERAQEAVGQARSGLRAQVDERSTQAGERLGSQASDIRTVAQQLREQGKNQPAKLAEQAAARTERIGDYLRRSDADRILRDVEDFGRRQPVAIMLGSLAVGLAASRLLKASSRQRYEVSQRHPEPASGPYRPTEAGSSTPVDETAAPPATVPPMPTAPVDPTRREPVISPTGGVMP